MSIPAPGVRWIFAFAVALSSAGSVLAQASVEPRGFGLISFSFQNINHTGHIHTDGTTDNIGLSANRDFHVEGDYGVTDHLTVSAGLPFVFSKIQTRVRYRLFCRFFPWTSAVAGIPVFRISGLPHTIT